MSKELTTISTGSAIELRRTHVSSVLGQLNNTDGRIYQASTDRQIKDYSDKELSESLARVFQLISFDIGYTAPKDRDIAAYQLTRLQTILRTYYSHYTLSEFKLSFELCAMGELDRYLPRDSQGNPDRKHYGQFNTEYISRVMKAYDRKRGEVFGKADKFIPRETKISEEDGKKYHNAILDKIRTSYNHYRETGRFEIPDNSEYFIFSWLKSYRWIDNTPTTEDDRKKAYFAYIQRAQRGLVKKIEEYKVRRDGTKSKELDFAADVVAMRRAIKAAFDGMVEKGIKIEDYLKYKL